MIFAIPGKHEVCTVSSSNTPHCACKPKYVHHDKYGCVDINPPTLRLRNDTHNDSTLRLKQGDEYREYMVDIIDDNAEDYLRSLKVSYSKPLPPGCLTDVGSFHVNYTIAMPWTDPPFARLQRNVVIDDIDECSLDVSQYKNACPILVPQCDTNAGAKCVNTIGSYSCQCPINTSGDGFKKDTVFPKEGTPPTSFAGGTGCTDTSKPVITLKGPNPKIFRTCACGGLTGVMNEPVTEEDRELAAEQRKLYKDDIKAMITSTSGAELCATTQNSKPSAADCVEAIDHTYRGDIDLTSRVVVGEPVQKSPMRWSVPYDVTDDAGNKATTVWRDIIVQEVDLADLETNIIRDVEREYEKKKKLEVEAAIKKEKIEWERSMARSGGTSGNRNRGRNSNSKSCPPCPECDCPSSTGGVVDAKSCESYCKNAAETCTMSDDSFAYWMILVLEDLLPTWVIPWAVLASIFFLGFWIVRWIFTLIFNPRALNSSYSYEPYRNGAAADSDLYVTNIPTPNAGRQSTTPSNSTNNGTSFFSPGSQAGNAGLTSPSPSMNGGSRAASNQYDDSIYQDIISPTRAGDGVRRRSPYRR